MPTKIDIQPSYELIERVKDFDQNEVIITIAVFDTPVCGEPPIYSISYLMYDTGGRPDYQDQALYYGAPTFYPVKLTEKECSAQMQYIKENLEQYKFKEI